MDGEIAYGCQPLVPEGVELRIHDSSLRDVKALEEAERDRRNRLLAAARFVPPNEVEHAHDEAKAFVAGVRRASIEGGNKAFSILRRESLRESEEEERERRTSTTAEIAFAALEHAHQEARAFREGLESVETDDNSLPPVLCQVLLNMVHAAEESERAARTASISEIEPNIQHALQEATAVRQGIETETNRATSVAHRASARQAEEEERDRRIADPDFCKPARQHAAVESIAFTLGLSSDLPRTKASDLGKKETAKAAEEVERDERTEDAEVIHRQRTHAKQEAKAVKNGLAQSAGTPAARLIHASQ
ncbi:uncharacterized protein SPPG_04780 [Spizellomyces punctatus DAOM BR117]|uniref:Uncharacterized protein n=1 Tax=Spizellomyces punctatus (strain DAOM BR117) TaxID=645134 RepID=A0A0L0HI14_SPIPD|nr:uncharacterized protein SPPG_04780 [Spizellomyces punctatus DAOM BR117]KND00464.1 hypothetical protein SPPG_04780 [Spizellomyces punctatus DAOM BR117]|eukprot:XP_016608503.1 hypothetical protein SPPG_04780 [Spizellomyces punctatus DAOM BR117]